MLMFYIISSLIKEVMLIVNDCLNVRMYVGVYKTKHSHIHVTKLQSNRSVKKLYKYLR